LSIRCGFFEVSEQLKTNRHYLLMIF